MTRSPIHRTGRRTLATAALAVVVAAPTAADRLVDAEEARRALDEARTLVDLRVSEPPPLKMEASVRALRLSNGEHRGDYVLRWATDGRYREEVRFQGYRLVEFGAGDERWREQTVAWVPVRVRQLLQTMDLATLLEVGAGERIVAARALRRRGIRQLEVDLSDETGRDRRIVLEELTRRPVEIVDPELSWSLAGWQRIEGRTFPERIIVDDGVGPVLEIEVRTLDEDARAPPHVFRPAPDARSATAPTSLDDPAWQQYRERLARFFERGWDLPLSARLGREGVVRLGFAVDRAGAIHDMRLIESSGSDELDTAALAAILRAAPLPTPPLASPPTEPGGELVDVTWRVLYNLEEADLPDLAPRRRGAMLSPDVEIPKSGECPAELAGVDQLMLAFLRAQRAPGAALAIVKDGRLVLARGYGWADPGAAEPVRPDALFRIASLSKPLTATAVLALAQNGRLALGDRGLERLGLVGEGMAVDPRASRVTVRHLLQHRGGFDRRVSFDPAWRFADIGAHLGLGRPATRDEVIRFVASRPLDFEPGTRFAYSNFGYTLLGRLIEEATGRPYADVVRDLVLEPLGMNATRLGRSRERAPGEVAYHLRDPRRVTPVDGQGDEGAGERVPVQSGGFPLEAIDSHGGWISSAIDVARFAASFDRPRRHPVLGARQAREMLERPAGRAGRGASGRPLASYYAAGWNVRPVGVRGAADRWHDGRLPGTSALVHASHDGVTWAVLFNQDRGADGMVLAPALAPLLHEVLEGVARWPEINLTGRW